jgi:hypothetical protein
MSRVARKRRPSRRLERRKKILGVEFKRLFAWLDSDRERPLTESFKLSGWLLTALEPLTSDGEAEADTDRLLLAHVICLRLKIVRDIESLTCGEDDDVKRHLAYQAELMLDSALGMALQRELQNRIDALIGSGDKTEARRWGVLKSELFHTCVSVRAQLTQGDQERAETFTDGLSVEDAPAAPVVRSLRLDAKPVRRLRRRRHRAVAVLRLLPTRTEILIAAAAVLAVVWFGFVRAPESTREQFKQLTMDDFDSDPAIIAVEAYPPSLVVSVDSVRWQMMASDEREALLREISFQLTTNGYRGAFIKSESGKPLAQWLVETGPRVFNDRAALLVSLPATDPSPQG